MCCCRLVAYSGFDWKVCECWNRLKSPSAVQNKVLERENAELKRRLQANGEVGYVSGIELMPQKHTEAHTYLKCINVLLKRIILKKRLSYLCSHKSVILSIQYWIHHKQHCCPLWTQISILQSADGDQTIYENESDLDQISSRTGQGMYTTHIIIRIYAHILPVHAVCNGLYLNSRI